MIDGKKMKLELFVEKIVVLMEEIMFSLEDLEEVMIRRKVIIIIKRIYCFLGGIFIEIRIIVVWIMFVEGLSDGKKEIEFCGFF